MKKIFLVLIILLSFVLRFYKLDSYPALNADEAAIGYNAYSLLQTGKDEHGNSWPIHFQSFNDYKPGLYVYLDMPFVAMLGLNECAVRIPGATLGVLTILMVYLLVSRLLLTDDKHSKLPLLSAFLVAISPWHIHFSRGGWEVNVATFFITTGVLFFLKGLNRPKFFILSSLFFVASLYTYHAARIIVPLLGLGLVVIYWGRVKEMWKEIIVPAILAILILLPLVIDLLGPAGLSRAAGVGLFADQGPLNRVNEQRGEHASLTSPYAKLLHNKPINYGLAFLENWTSHYSGEFLFLNGDVIQRNRVPETGQMYIFEIITLGVGLWYGVKNIRTKAGWKIIIWWLVIAPIAAALTFQSPHALRAENMVIPLAIISAYGLYIILMLVGSLRTNLVKVLCYALLSIFVLVSFTRYLHMYYFHMAKDYPFSSQYGVKELVQYVTEVQNNYSNIVITDRYDQPYILFLFYMKYPPAKFQQEHILTARDQFGFSTVRNFDKYVFQPIELESVKTNYPNSLIVATEEEVSSKVSTFKDIYGSNNHLYFKVETTKYEI